MTTFLTVLLALFVGFKLAGIVAWSWIWVLSPLWLPIFSMCFFIIFAVLISHPR